METKTKIFDAVAESRKWRETTSRKLDAMARSERIAYLREVADRYRAAYAQRHVALEAVGSSS